MNYSDILKLKKEFEEQKLLEKYQSNRQLPRPKTNVIAILLLCAVFIAILAIGVWLLCHAKHSVWKIIFLALLLLLFSELYLRYLGVKIVECYQHYAKEETRRRCLCVPSCSEYAILCFRKFELIYALIKIRKRLYVTCRGDDFIIDFPYQEQR